MLMEAANTSEVYINFCSTTRRNNSEYGHLHTRRRENLKSHLMDLYGRPAQLGRTRVPICKEHKQFRAATSFVVTRVKWGGMGEEATEWYFEFVLYIVM
jgi:hypothetical protein